MKDIQVTLYDIFGYLIPGSVALGGVYLIAWRVVLPVNQDWTGLSAVGWTVVLGVAYVLGHSVQALSILILRLGRWNPEQVILLDTSVIPEEVVWQAKRLACRAIGLPENGNVTPQTLYDIMDHYLQQHGKTDVRDIYIYREGFYRGLATGLLLFAIGLVFRMTGEQGNLVAFGATLTVARAAIGFVAVVSVLLALLALVRCRRFAVYRVKNSLYSFLAICGATEQGGAE